MSKSPSVAPRVPVRIVGADWLDCPQAQAVFAAIESGGEQARAVGGAVRNALIGLPVADVDIATTAMPETVSRLAIAAGLTAIPTGIDHGTITVVSGKQPYEVTTLRQDVATDGRRATIAFTADWVADASRRDFTMNALYCDADGRVFDPLGGYDDLVARRVRFIGDARQRIREDYLRILRFFRFIAQYGSGAPDPVGLSACVAEREGLGRLSAERLRAELLKLLVAPGALQSMEAMFEHGLLVDVLAAVPWPNRLVRIIALENGLGLAADPLLRLSALAIPVEEDCERIAERLRLSNAERRALTVFSRCGPIVENLDEAAARKLLYRLGGEAWSRYVLAAWSLSGCDSTDQYWKNLLSLPDRWQPPPMPVRGADVLALGVPAGPQVGAILTQFEQWWLESGFLVEDQTVKFKLNTLVKNAGGS